MKCDRCLQNSGITTMSMFNMDTICMPCKEVESKHPDYENARKVEANEVKRGNMNYPGIGLPSDLRK